jgi:hypothetical protein
VAVAAPRRELAQRRRGELVAGDAAVGQRLECRERCFMQVESAGRIGRVGWHRRQGRDASARELADRPMPRLAEQRRCVERLEEPLDQKLHRRPH